MKQYDDYQVVAQKWVDEIPEHWDFYRIKRIFAQRVEKNDPVITENILSLTAKQGVVPIAEKEGAGGNKPKGDMTQYNVARPDDLLVNCMNIVSGSAGVSRYFGAISPVYYALYPRLDCNVWYYHYLFRLMPFQRSLLGLGKGILMHESDSGKLNTVRMRISMDYLGNVPLPVPPRAEQDQIVRYLDWQVSKINRLIAAKRKQIKLLEATTAHYLENTIHKGTRNEQLVETGNPWINSAPISWKKVRHKNVLTEKKEVVGENHSQYTLLSLTTKGVIIRDTSSGKGKYPSDFSTYQVVNPSNMVFCLFDVDETPRTVGLSTHTGMITGAYTVYETHDALPEYLLYYFLSVDNKKGFKPLYSGLRKVIGKDVFSRQAIYLPSIEEQKEIVDAIQIRQAKSRNAIDLLEREIESLHDLRTRLISDVVTGQVDVRGIKVPDDEYINNEITEEEFEEESENNEEE